MRSLLTCMSRCVRTATVVMLCSLALTGGAGAQDETRAVRIPLHELGLRADVLRLSDRGAESFAFTARADHLLTAAALELDLSRLQGESELSRLEVLLNGEPQASFGSEQLARGRRQRVQFDAGLLASTNVVTLRLTSARGRASCGRVPVGSWSALRAGSLLLESEPLPLSDDLSLLPLPFFDPEFDREQTLHFVLGARATSEQLEAANMVASWFSLQGRGRLSFEVHAGRLPTENAVVFVADDASARALGLAIDDQHASALALRAHPDLPARKLLVISGRATGDLARAARLLVRDGYALSSAGATPRDEHDSVELPQLAPHEVPRWAKPGDLVLGALPEQQPLRVEGGHSTALRLAFRLAPDLFAWPSDYVELDLGYTQGISARTGAASLHVALNGSSLGTLPSVRKGRTRLRVSRDLLRGYNELLLQVSYPPQRGGEQCESRDDPKAWVALAGDSRLRLGALRRHASVPDLGLFLYDGFPFSEHGDLREGLVVLPSAPDPRELSTMLGAVAHLATVTGHPSSALRVVLGTPSAEQLRGHDVLLISALGRHPLLRRWSDALPLAERPEGVQVVYPKGATWLRRVLSGQLDDRELRRANEQLEGGAFGAAVGIVAPWDESRSVVVITASTPARMPDLRLLQEHAKSRRTRNDLLLQNEKGQALFQLSVEQGRGALPRLLSLRFWLAHYWLLLAPLLCLAALAWGLFAHRVLSQLARERLARADG